MQKGILITLLALLAACCAWLIYRQTQLQKQVADLQQTFTLNSTREIESETDFELAPMMNRFQLYMNKLWFAAQGSNWELAAFYVHELEECMEEITEHEVIENGVKVHELIEDWGLKPLSQVENVVKAMDEKKFLTEYDNLMRNCNSCHVATKHPFINIIKPQGELPAFSNQKYSIK